MDILELMRTRYTTKHYDPNRRVSDQDMDTLLEVLRLSPSSTNIQPWKFYVIDTPEMKERIMPAVKDFNIERMQAPQLIIFTVPTCFSEEFFDELYRQEEADGRYKGWKSPERPDVIRLTYSHKFDDDPEGLFRYASNQAFIALGCVTVALQRLVLTQRYWAGLILISSMRSSALKLKMNAPLSALPWVTVQKTTLMPVGPNLAFRENV